MAQYLILQDDPFTYRERVLQFWREYLPDTPPYRLEWMMKGNPAGPASWFFAFEQKTGDLVGMISVMPRELMLGGLKLRAGIMGDLVVARKFRVFGPALGLVKKVVQSIEHMNLAFIYTIPNSDSEKLVERAGFFTASHLFRLVRPINFSRYQKKYTRWPLSILPSAITEYGFKFISRDTYSQNPNIQEQIPKNEELDALWQRSHSNAEAITGVRESKFIRWRFIENPMSCFQMIACRDQKSRRLTGYVAYTMEDDRLHIHDLFADTNLSAYQLLNRVRKIARRNACVGIYVALGGMNPFIRAFRKCCYYDTGDKAPILIYGNEKHNFSTWDFFSGDRNI